MTPFSYFVWIVLLLWTSLFISKRSAQLINVALNKPCNMSSSYTDGVFNNNCSCAINGNTGTTYTNGNCIHTNPSDEIPTWTVYLGQNYLIQRITIYARDYELYIRLKSVQVFIDDVEVYNFSATPSTVTNITDKLPRTGNRVRLQKVNDGFSSPMLVICEVQVFVLKIYCDPNPCANGGTCTEGVNTYSCSCAKGYTGTNCTSDVDECRGQPNPCYPGTCNNSVGSYSCQCPAGYIGSQHCTDVDECKGQPNPCSPGTCYNSDGSYSCQCPPGFIGSQHCTDVDECRGQPNPCSPSTCYNSVGSYSCQCPPGYTGSQNCTDINECYLNSSLCLPGNCSNTDGSFNCTCPRGYDETNNCTDKDECTKQNRPCNGGSCVNIEGSYICLCGPGYTGNGTSTCNDINECETLNRLCNNGTCMNNPGSFICDCNKGYTGNACEKDVDKCASNPCANGGTCSEGVASYTCSCPCGYTGFDCRDSALAEQSAQNNAGPIVGAFFGGFVSAICLMVTGYCIWKRRNSPNTNNRHYRESLPDSTAYYNTANASIGKTPGTPESDTQRQEVRKSADGSEVSNATYDTLHPYSNDVTPDAAAYTSLHLHRKIH